MSLQSRKLGTFVLLFLYLVAMVLIYAFLANNVKDSLPDYFLLTGVQDVGLMMFVGFAGLYAYMKYNGLTGVGFCLLLTPVAMLVYVLWFGLWERAISALQPFSGEVHYSITTTYLAYYCAAAVLISFGGVYGKVGVLQCVVFLLIEVIVYSINQVICLQKLHCVDAGGSMTIHTFGAAFGLVMAGLYKPRKTSQNDNNGSNVQSNIIGTIGSMFLWVFWPSFNSLLVSKMRKELAMTNTVFSLCMSVISSVAFSFLINGKFSMEDLINSTLAGGVIVGSTCDISLNPAASLFIGFLGGIVSTVGFNVISPKLRAIGLEDTAGIFNLHFLPGLIGGFYSSIIVVFYGLSGYPYSQDNFKRFTYTFNKQAQNQAACTAISLALGLGSGLLAALVLRFLFKSGFEQHVQSGCLQEEQQQVKNLVKQEHSFLYQDYVEWNINLVIERQQPKKYLQKVNEFGSMVMINDSQDK